MINGEKWEYIEKARKYFRIYFTYGMYMSLLKTEKLEKAFREGDYKAFEVAAEAKEDYWVAHGRWEY